MNPSLRETKAARTRIQLSLALVEALRTTDLDQVRVEDIAARAGVSRMTFFNYFPSKEAAVAWAFAADIYRLQVELEVQGLRGLPAILRIGQHFLDEIDATGLDRLYAVWRTGQVRPEALRLTEADRLALAGGAKALPLLSFGQLLTRELERARERGELRFAGSAYEFAHFLGAVLHGHSFVGGVGQGEAKRTLGLRHLHRALGLPLDQAGPPTPVPPAYSFSPADPESP